MSEETRLHEGHRERMQDKLFLSPNSLKDHELLEILLYGCISRKDTNPLAHELLQVFGSLNGVLSATAEDLLQINGVGKKVADHIRLMGKLSEVIGERINYDNRKPYNTLEKAMPQMAEFFAGEINEKFVFILLDKQYKQIYKLEYSSAKADSVFADNGEIVYALAMHKPEYVIMAHNHPGASPEPSDKDNESTIKLLRICGLHGVGLIDHIIYSDKEIYSYHYSGMLDKFKEFI